MKVKRMIKRMAAIVCLLAVFLVVPVSAASEDSPYYKNTFQLLNHKNVRSSLVISKNTHYQSGWFKTQEYSFGSDTYMMVAYNVAAFTDQKDGATVGDVAPDVFAQIGVMESGLTGLTLESGGILEIKFDWYYNIRLIETIYADGGVVWGASNFPVTGLDPRTKMYFSSSNSTGWFVIDATEIKNHGLYSGSSSADPDAIYRSTVTFRFHNDTPQTLEFEMFAPYYDAISGWKEPQFKDTLNHFNNGKIPKDTTITSVYLDGQRSYAYMGYKTSALPSYKIVSAAAAPGFETDQSIQQASDQIISSMEQEMDELASSIDQSINNAFGDESEFQSDPDRYTDKTEEGNKHNSDLKDQEDQKEAILNDAVNGASDALKEYNFVDVGVMIDGMESLGPTFAVISDGFGKILGSLGVEFGSFFMYLIAGGVLLALLGEIAGAFSSGIRSKRRSAAAEKKRKGD